MAPQGKNASNKDEGFAAFFWNIVGGAMVAAMLSGVFYVLMGMVGKYLNHTDQFWELTYLKWYFITILAIYLLMPVLLANAIGFIFGSKSRASGTKPRT